MTPRLPQLTARELVHFLKSQGFVADRQSGSHLTLWHEARKLFANLERRGFRGRGFPETTLITGAPELTAKRPNR
ncbi:MAG: type II toxin-antitoxin system HicA family toxin [Gammaproteobacteria bacterium]|nr:type II toxin-antitoxin system HicA family toxin [Gammaproteobacteria bacterium]